MTEPTLYDLALLEPTVESAAEVFGEIEDEALDAATVRDPVWAYRQAAEGYRWQRNVILWIAAGLAFAVGMLMVGR